MSPFLQGATMLGSFAIAIFFLRYWRVTHDRLFGVFAAAFALFGANRIVLSLLDPASEARTWVYALRAAAFIMIIAAVVDKNLSRGSVPRETGTIGSRAEDE
jgi:hypothetical protein